MAENEIIKHAQKAFSIMKSPGKDIRHKLGEILIEILIIVIAVTISIWVHNWNEKRNEKREETAFLTGLKKDLQCDIENITSSRNFYASTLQGISYFLKAGSVQTINLDSINKYSDCFFSSTDLDPHIARYEALKSSGRFIIIENKELLNDIIELHESTIKRIEELNVRYDRHTQQIASLISQNAILGKSGQVTNSASMLGRSDLRILMSTSWGLIANNIIPIHKTGISKCQGIISRIDQELK
ncbi:MAG: DUF6090 family protein [Bacteroidota bacterium]